MKVGDLVELSAKGRSLKSDLFCSRHGEIKVGVVTGTTRDRFDGDPLVKVLWSTGKQQTVWREYIKYLKTKKKDNMKLKSRKNLTTKKETGKIIA